MSDTCPKCGADTETGYGLACGPGIGVYEYCANNCGWFVKFPDPGTDEPAPGCDGVDMMPVTEARG